MLDKFILAKKALANPEKIPPYILNNTSIGTTLQKYNAIYNATLSLRGASISPMHPDIPETEKPCKLQALQTKKNGKPL